MTRRGSPGPNFANTAEEWLVPEAWELDAEAQDYAQRLERDATQSAAKLHFYDGIGLPAAGH